jgi:putative addiction module component (TIGR02574 family)
VYHFNMSFTELLQELPALTVAERQILIRRALELDDSPLSPHEEALIDERLAAHRRDPDSAVPLDEMKKRLRSRLGR